MSVYFLLDVRLLEVGCQATQNCKLLVGVIQCLSDAATWLEVVAYCKISHYTSRMLFITMPIMVIYLITDVNARKLHVFHIHYNDWQK